MRLLAAEKVLLTINSERQGAKSYQSRPRKEARKIKSDAVKKKTGS